MAKPYLGRILIVEDDKDMRALLKSSLEYEGFQCKEAECSTGATRLIDQFSFDAVLLDLSLGEESGLELIPEISRSSPFSKIIVMTAFGSIDLAVDAMERGATTFLTKSESPQKITEELRNRLKLRTHTKNLEDRKPSIVNDFGIVGSSQAMTEILDHVDQIKDIDATVLLFGESGTGKELFARAIHRLSDRRESTFEAINCGAIPDNLLESELFGYKKGAFTDAKSDRKGVFEICSQGTLFLDEIGEMPLALQVKLLRILQEKEIKPIGASHSYKVNTRVVCATNKNLENEVKKGTFREDLYFRLSIFPVHIPPLRKRRQDIPELVDYFINLYSDCYKRKIKPLTKETLSKIVNHEWPGNVRQLQNSIERAVVLSKDGCIHLDNMFVKHQIATEGHNSTENNEFDTVVYSEAKENFERSFLIKILTASRGNISEAARISGRFRSDIYRLMEKYEIEQQKFR